MQTRKELLLIMNAYLEAVIEKNPSSLSVSSNCKCTYNGHKINLGESRIWKNTLVISERQTFVDPIQGGIVFFGIFHNETRDKNMNFKIPNDLYYEPYYVTIRLKVIDGKIAESEELSTANRLIWFYADQGDIHLPDLEFEMIVPEEERSTREELVNLVNTYWDCTAKKLPWNALPAHPDAQRIENGYRTTNHSYSFLGDFKHNKGFYWEVPYSMRSNPVIDPARGVIVNYCFLEYGVEATPDARGARIVEAFKVKDGLLCHLMAFFPVLDEGGCGWEV